MFIVYAPKAQFPVSGIFRAGGILDNKKLLSRNYLINFRAIFSPANNRIPARSENCTDWKSALISVKLVLTKRQRNVKTSSIFLRNLWQLYIVIEEALLITAGNSL